MYQQLYVYAGPDRQSFRYISEPEPILEFPEHGYYGSQWCVQLPDQSLPEWFVVVDIPLIRQWRVNETDLVPRIEIFLAPVQDQGLYGDPMFPFSQAA
jgi:hypothetical protein